MGDGLLIDAGSVPALDCHIVRLSLLVAGTGPPAMTDQEVCGGDKRVGTGADQIDMSIAVAVHAIADDIGREKLGLADFAMRRPLGGGAEVAPLDRLKGGLEQEAGGAW